MTDSPIPPLHITDLEVRGLDADGDEQVYADFVVRTFELRERICEPYSLMLSLATRQRRLHVRGLVGGRCLLRFGRGEFERDIHGVVLKAETIGVIQEKLCVRLFVAPAMEVLGLSKRMRVFQGRSAVDIVKELVSPVFATYGGTIDTSRIEHATFRTRDCCMQYDETDFEFAQRLLAEEGIAFTFRHGGEAEELVLLPMTAILHSVTGEDDTDPQPVPLCPREPELAPQESIQNLQGSTRMRARGAEAAMWDWKANPPVRVSTRAEPLDGDSLLPASNARFGEVYAFESYRPVEEEEGGPIFEDGIGEANMLGHQQRVEDVRASGYGNACGFTDGATFEVAEHPTEDLEGLYVVLSVVHHAELDVNADGTHVRSTASYGNRFTCYRFGARGHEGYYEFAPEPRRKPLAHGPMMATVVGPPGEEIHTDEHGRIKVRMHWDRGEHGRDDHERSCWVPVRHAWAGPGYGAVFVPRVGMEVVISFVGGDPDRPLCTGVVFNGQNRPPYALPDDKTRSVIKTSSSPGGGGFNELSFEDAAGSEEVYLHAERNLREVVKRQHSTSVGGSQTCNVSGNQSNTVGGDQSNTVHKDQTELVKGDVAVTIEGSRTRTVGGKETLTLEAARETYVGDTELHQVTAMLTESFDGGRTTFIGNGDGEVVTSGDKSIVVTKGSLAIYASSSIALTQDDARLVLENGATLSTTGDFSITNGRVSVNSSDGKLEIRARDELRLTCGSSSIVLGSDGSIDVIGSNKVAVAAGSVTTFLAEPAGATISAPKITSSASAVCEILGPMVKIN
jgi:type VI secretion system secreted protein VgrG